MMVAKTRVRSMSWIIAMKMEYLRFEIFVGDITESS